MKRAFQTTLVLVAFIPCVLGAMSLIYGAERLMPSELINANLDGQVRFWGIRSMLPFFLTLWIVTNLDKACSVLVIVIAATATGALARLVASYQYGAPDPALLGIIAFELAVLLFIPWYNRLDKQGLK